MTVSRDALDGRYLPDNSSEWTELLSGTGIPNPNHLYLFQESAGPTIFDVIGTKHLTGSGTLFFQSTTPGFARKGVLTAAGNAGKMINNTFGNVNANSYTVLLLAYISVAGGVEHTIMRMGTTFDDDATYESNPAAGPQIGEGDGTRSAITADVRGAGYFYGLRIDDLANQVDGFFNSTKILGGAQACNGTELCFGGDNLQTWYPNTAYHLYAAVWDGVLSDADWGVVTGRMMDGPPVVGGSGDITPPTITIVGPPPGSVIGPSTAITFRYSDNSGLRRPTPMIKIEQSDGSFKYELIHDGDSFTPDYVGVKTVVQASPPIWEYTVARKGGWTATLQYQGVQSGDNIVLVPFGTDSSGNEPV